uniref:Uncharacterized protein n=1 Tax=Anopheles merus TaxID=30066 RepID=A0A182VK12_ANOME
MDTQTNACFWQWCSTSCWGSWRGFLAWRRRTRYSSLNARLLRRLRVMVDEEDAPVVAPSAAVGTAPVGHSHTSILFKLPEDMFSARPSLLFLLLLLVLLLLLLLLLVRLRNATTVHCHGGGTRMMQRWKPSDVLLLQVMLLLLVGNRLVVVISGWLVRHRGSSRCHSTRDRRFVALVATIARPSAVRRFVALLRHRIERGVSLLPSPTALDGGSGGRPCQPGISLDQRVRQEAQLHHSAILEQSR